MGSSCSICKLNLETCSKRRSQKHLSITLNVTDRCNDKCNFCWHRKIKNKNKDMTEKNIDNMLNILLKQFPDYDISFIFMGGEPTLNLSIIQYAMKSLIEKKGKCHGTLVTNGSGDIKDIINIINLYQNLKVIVSLPNTHTSRDVTQNIDKYIELQNKFNINFSLVITENDIQQGIYDNILYWKNKGIINLSLIHQFDMFNVKIKTNNYETLLFNELMKLKNLLDDSFMITNFYPSIKRQFANLNLIKIAYFSNEQFYMSNKSKFFQNDSIGDTVNGIDMNKYVENLNKLPCFLCELKNSCNYDVGLFFKNNQSIKNESFCIPMMVFLKIKEIYNDK